MKVSAWPKKHVFNLSVFVVIANHLRVAPSLVRGVHDASKRAAREGFDESVKAFDLFQFLPLLELDYHNVCAASVVVARHQEIDALCRVGKVVFDCHAGVVGNVVVVEHLVHVLK